MSKKLTTRQAIVKVMTDNGKAMKAPEIIAAGVKLTALSGKTPGQTFYSILYSEAKKQNGIVKRSGRGEFKLGENAAEIVAPKPSAKERATAKAAQKAAQKALDKGEAVAA